MKTRSWIVVLCVVSAALRTPPVNAQERVNFEAGSAFSTLASGHCCVQPDRSFPAGWNVSVGIGLQQWLWIVGEVGGDYQTSRTSAGKLANVDPATSTHIYSVLAGPKVSFLNARRVTVFGNILVGPAFRTGKLTDPVSRSEFSIASSTQFAVQPGVGIDLTATRQFLVRVRGDYRVTDVSEGTLRQSRLLAGVVFRR